MLTNTGTTLTNKLVISSAAVAIRTAPFML
jgi:hypothetical protein